MLRNMLYYIHISCAYAIAIYTLLIFILDIRLRKLNPDSTKYRASNLRFFLLNRFMSYLLLFAFLLGSYMGTPYFKVGFTGGAGWIFIKLFLFVLLLGNMGALGSRALKLRLRAAENAGRHFELLKLAKSRMNHFKVIQLILVVSIFFLAYFKPF